MSYHKNDKGYKYRYRSTDIPERYLRLQIDNNLRLGWAAKDIIVASNFDFAYNGVQAINIGGASEISAFANKMPSVHRLIKDGVLADDLFIHDVDVYTLISHPIPTIAGVGMVLHSLPPRGKLQGGATYVRKDSYDIICELAENILRQRVRKEETYLAKSGFYAQKYKDRFTLLNYRYNLFRQGEFHKKYPLTELPVINTHFHFEDESCTKRFVEGINKYGVKIVPQELKELAIYHGLYTNKKV